MAEEKPAAPEKDAAGKKPVAAPETAPAGKKKPTSAALKAAVAQLEEEETGKKKNTPLMRVGALLLWILAAVAMYCPQIGELGLPFGACRMLFLNCVTECIVDIVVAGVLCVLAALLWKKANHIHPTKSHNKTVQFLWNQLGVIMAGVILAPLAIIMIARSDKLDAKTKKLVAAVLAVVFLGAAAGSADYHPVTQDEVNQIIEQADENGYTGDVYWTKYGHSYHFSLDCPSLRNSQRDNIYSGTLEEALAANRTDPCDFCANGREAKATAEGTEDKSADAAEAAATDGGGLALVG